MIIIECLKFFNKMHEYDDATLDPCKRTKLVTPHENEVLRCGITGMPHKAVLSWALKQNTISDTKRLHFGCHLVDH
jgi:hypothetical protein